MPNTWIVVANASRARILDAETLMKVDELTHVESRAKVRDLVSGPRGRTHTDIESQYSAYERHTDPHQAEMDVFARDLARRLGAGRVSGEVGDIVLVAGPAFLGRLRDALDHQTAKLVRGSIDHDWTSRQDADLVEEVRNRISI